jgi:glycosyltransferase involved in cell wall biosynthesis
MNPGRPNILLVTARADYGGGPEHMYRLIKLLHKEVNYFAACPNDHPYRQKYAEILGKDKIILIPHRKFRLSALKQLMSFVKKNRITIVHSHGKGAGIYSRMLSKLTGLKCIHTFHGIHTGEYSSVKKRIYLSIEKVLSSFTNKFISVSESEAQTVVTSGITSKDKITVIPNGTYIPLEISSYEFKVLYNIIHITRFDYAKNTLLLIPIARELLKIKGDKEFRFIILGKGEDEKEFLWKITEEKIEKLFDMKGFLPDTGDYLKNSFCYISTSRWEGLPLSVLEAMSYGVPVVASNVNGNSDLVKHGLNGYLYDVNNPSEAAGYIMKLTEDEKKYKELSANGRRIAETEYSLDKMAEKTLKLYLSVK